MTPGAPRQGNGTVAVGPVGEEGYPGAVGEGPGGGRFVRVTPGG